MSKYTQQTNIAQSSIGFQIYAWQDPATDTGGFANGAFEYLVPIVGDPQALGGEPSTIETTEADSKVRTYVSDRPDSVSVTFQYNFDDNGNNYLRAKEAISNTTARVFLMLLPLGSAFMIKATGATWLEGGNPVQGSISFTQAEEAIFIKNLTSNFTADEVALINNWLGDSTVDTSDNLTSIIDFTTMPVGRETEAVKNATTE